MRIEPTGATLGAVVTEVSLGTLDEAAWRGIERAFLDHAVLAFPGQHCTEAEQVAFARRFGELSIETLTFTNRAEDGSLRPPTDPLVQLLAGNEGWHTDSSFQPVAAKASMLTAREVPATGGETEWADMRAAYDALDEATRGLVEGLAAHHSLFRSQSRLGRDGGATAAGIASLYGRSDHGARTAAELPPAPRRPLVKVHPVTGRKALFIGRHAFAIPGLAPAESDALLERLVDEACRPPRVFTHRWTPGDLVVWDNRCVLHRARPYDPGEARTMVHSRVAGDPQTETAEELVAFDTLAA
ncbi:MAG: TauD/TfdA family dioxygenase [Acidimicrobiia bacterium]|nr:TauD/TfdA family dioxygenase [Acidimicrobiia bacterium]